MSASVSRFRACVIAAAAVGIAAGASRADLITDPVKWSQPITDLLGVPWPLNPDPIPAGTIKGIDRLSNHGATLPRVLADDFVCLDPRPIRAVRWWGSYRDETSQRADTGAFDQLFHISFHTFVGGQDSVHPFSTPGTLLYFQAVKAQRDYVGKDSRGDYVYRYDAYIKGFAQTPGQEYFLDIDSPNEATWGWHETTLLPPGYTNGDPDNEYAGGNNDFAATAGSHAGQYNTANPLFNLAFELMVPEPGTMAVLGLGLLGFVRRRRSTSV